MRQSAAEIDFQLRGRRILLLTAVFIPFAAAVVEQLLFDPRPPLVLAAYALAIPACIPWIAMRFEHGTARIGCLILATAPFALLVHLIAVAFFSLSMFDSIPRSAVAVHQDHGSYVFDIRTRGCNGLLRLAVWDADSRELYWRIDLDYYHGRRLAYGDVPQEFKTDNGNTSSAKQTYPPQGRPRPLPQGRRFVVEVEYQFDVLVSPSVGGDDFAFTTDAEGRVLETASVPVGTLERPLEPRE